jgi:hypothetical protein
MSLFALNKAGLGALTTIGADGTLAIVTGTGLEAELFTVTVPVTVPATGSGVLVTLTLSAFGKPVGLPCAWLCVHAKAATAAKADNTILSLVILSLPWHAENRLD